MKPLLACLAILASPGLAAQEARFVNTDLSSKGHHRYGSTRSYLAFGASLRF